MTRPLATVVRVVAEVVAFTVLVLICAAPGLMWYTHDVSHMVVSLDGVWAFLTEHLIFSGVSLGAASYLYAVTAWEYKKDRPRNSVKARTQRPADFPPPYPNGWYLVQLSHNVARGTVVAVDALGQQFVVFRGHDDVVAILDAYCPHLGAHLGEGGTVTRNNCLRCPFHGWEFDANGKCRSIEGTTSIPTGSDIRKHASSEVNGGIFLWYHAGGVEPQWELDASSAISAGWHYRSGVVTSYVNTHIREIPENGSDSAHLNVLHKNFVVDWLQKTGLYHYWTATWAPHPTVKHKSSISLTQEMRLGVRVPMTLVKTVIEQRGPGAVSLQLFTPLGLVHAFEYITPVSSMQQRVVHVMYCSPHVPYMVGRFLLWALDKQFHRDQPIWERKRLVPRPVISKADGPIMEFRRWWSQFYSPESVDMATAIAKENMMDW